MRTRPCRSRRHGHYGTRRLTTYRPRLGSDWVRSRIRIGLDSIFGCIYEAVKAGYDAEVPVLIAGYPTFVANQDLHAISIQAGIEDTGTEKSNGWRADWKYKDTRYSERIAFQRQQVALFLQYIDVERVAAHKVVKVMSGRSIEQPSDQFST